MLRQLTFTFVLLSFMTACKAQSAEVRPTTNRLETKAVECRKSPIAISSMRLGDAYAKIVYGQPHLRGRTMLGKIESYGDVWRLGANEATEIFTNTDLKIGDKVLPAGAHSMFAIPYEDHWTLIFNKGLGQWGAYAYDEDEDVIRVDAKRSNPDKEFEAFTMWFSDAGDKLNMAWGKDMVSFPVTFVR